MTDTELVKKLDPEGKYTFEWVMEQVNECRKDNELNKRSLDTGVLNCLDIIWSQADFKSSKILKPRYSDEYLRNLNYQKEIERKYLKK
jgi:hypothetical protein